MKTIDEAIDAFLADFGKRASGRVVAILAVVLYGGLGLALPLLLGWPVPWLVSANITGTTLAATFIIVWIAAQFQAAFRRHLIEWTTDLRLLDSAEFEWLVGEIFRREGWKVDETGRRDRPDGNVDLRLVRDGRHVLVQCKRWVSWAVGVDDVRSFAGALMREGLKGSDGIFVTLSDFTEQARSEAEELGVALIDNRDLYVRMEAVRRTEACPICGSTMLLGRSNFGWWFRCVKKGCAGKRDLGRDPGRAVELLTEPPA
jgi:Restriction endonuclease